MVPCARKLFCYKSEPCRVPALSHSAGLGIPRSSAQGGQAILSAAVPSQLQWRCVSRLPHANSATRKCKSVFLQGCYADRGGEEGALNKLYFLGIIVRKKLSFGGSQSLEISFVCLRLSSSGKICLVQVRKCLWNSTCLWGAQWLERKEGRKKLFSAASRATGERNPCDPHIHSVLEQVRRFR